MIPVLTGSVLTGSVLTDIMRTGMVEIAMLVRTGISKPAYQNRHIRTDIQSVCQIVFTVLCMCRGRQTESSVSGMAVPDKEEAPYLGRWSRRASHPFNHGAGHGGIPQVDDVICLHHTVDRSGTGEQGTGMERLSSLWQRRPGLSGADAGQAWPQWLIRSTHVSPSL